MVRPTGPTVVLRPRSSQALGVSMVAAAAVGVVVATLEGRSQVLSYGAPLVLFGLLGWAAYWCPHVEVSDGGVKVANTWRTVQVPWPAIEEVEGRYGLRMRTSYGTVNAWGAPAPSGRARARADTSLSAASVEERREELRAAGYLDSVVLEKPRLAVTWHQRLIAVSAVLVVACVALPLLG